MLTRAKQAVIDRLGITRLASATDRTSRAVDELEQRLAAQLSESVRAERQALADTLAQLQTRLVDAERIASEAAAAADALRSWQRVSMNSALLTVLAQTNTPISVVMATRNRSRLCARAVQSVLGQRHAHWQLVVVDDGSSDETPAALAAFDDPRIVRLRTSGIGAAAARNEGLAAATGEWVAFVDDDNIMDPGWLHAIAVHAARQPSAVAVYGAQLRQHEADAQRASWAEGSLLFANANDLAALHDDNSIDLGALAVRRATLQLHFNAELRRFIDWDLVVRLHRAHGLQPLPVWSGVYTTEAIARISDEGGPQAIAAFRARIADLDDPVGAFTSERTVPTTA